MKRPFTTKAKAAPVSAGASSIPKGQKRTASGKPSKRMPSKPVATKAVKLKQTKGTY